MKPKILFFCRFPPPYNSGQTIGTEIVFTYLGEHFECDKIDLSYDDNMVGSGIIKSIKYSFFLFNSVILLARKLKAYDFLYVVPGMSVQGIARDLVSVFLGSIFNKKIVFHFRNANVHSTFKSGFRRKILGYYFKKVYRFIFLSDHLLSLNKDSFPLNKCTVIPNSIDESVILSEDEFNRKLAIQKSRETVKVLYISNLIESKGYLDLIEALGLLKQDKIDFTCDLIGGVEKPSDLDFLRSRIDELQLKEHVTVHGILSDRERIKEFYTNSDIFILPTYFPLEAQPRSIIESMNAGNAVIATQHASIPEYVFPGENGLFVEKRNPNDIKEKITEMILTGKYLDMAIESRNIFKAKFSSKAIKQQLIQIFADEED